MIRDEIQELVAQALAGAQGGGELPSFAVPEVQLEHPARPEHGDYSANLPLRIQGLARMKALEVAEALRKHVPAHHAVSEVRVAPPGFLNFYLEPAWLAAQAAAITAAGAQYASSSSARAAGCRSSTSRRTRRGRCTSATAAARPSARRSPRPRGRRATTSSEEYYVNDAGTQVAVFARTLYARYQQLFGREVDIPENGYPGAYMVDIAARAQGSSRRPLPAPEPASEAGPELGTSWASS